MNKSSTQQIGMFALLVALAAGSRFINVAPNFHAVAAIALFAGWYFSSRGVAIAAPLVVMLATDAFIGGYDWRLMVVVYAALALPVLMGRLLHRLGASVPGLRLVALSSLSASVLFFLVTNFAVWAFSADVAYPKTMAGLVECFVNAVPFLKFTLAGDLVFGLGLFGAYGYFTRRAASARLAAA